MSYPAAGPLTAVHGTTCRSCNASFLAPMPSHAFCPRCDRPISAASFHFPPVRPAPTPGERALLGACRGCGCLLTVAERSTGLCDAPGCRVKDARRAAEQHEREAADHRARLAERAGVDASGEVTIAEVPSMDRPLVEVAPERAARLAAHVARVLSDAAAGIAEVPHRLTRATPRPGAESSYAALCGTCQGYCCRAGADEAYLDQASLVRVAATVGLPMSALPDFYAGQIPSRAVQGSCVFHGEAGCAMPAEHRSNTCNAFFCDGVIDFASRVTAVSTPEALAIACLDGVITRSRRFVIRASTPAGR